jgi:hypothetical protein
MTYLSQVTTGKPKSGQRIVIAGPEGIGKTTLSCDAPNSLLIPLENGFTAIETPHLPNVLQTWQEVESLCQELIAGAKAGTIARGSSLVWDSVTALERIINAETLNRDTPQNKTALGKTHSMETSHGGYGKAYPIANGLFETWLRYMDELAEYGGINIIITCHVFVVRLIDPSAGEYDSTEILLHSPRNSKTYGKREHLTQWADMIGYLHEPVLVVKNKDEKISKGIGGSGRVLELDRSPAWTAKNRYGLSGSISIPREHGWNSVANAIHASCGIDLFNRATLPTNKEA